MSCLHPTATDHLRHLKGEDVPETFVGGVITMCVLSPASVWSSAFTAMEIHGVFVSSTEEMWCRKLSALRWCLEETCLFAQCRVHAHHVFFLACTMVITPENIMFATSNRLRHERGNPRKMPEVRLMTLKRDLRGWRRRGGGRRVGCQAALFIFTPTVCGHHPICSASPLTSSATDVPFRRLEKSRRIMPPIHTHTHSSHFMCEPWQ